jgi:hypothetical protein
MRALLAGVLLALLAFLFAPGCATVLGDDYKLGCKDVDPDKCDALANCDKCIDCALRGPCKPESDACSRDEECTALNQCHEDCKKPAPQCGDSCDCDACDTRFPHGASVFDEITSCVLNCACWESCKN